ncbi:MAG: YciI family protein [Cyanobacteria bacterium J06627_8]
MPWFVKIETGIVEKAIFDQYVPEHKTFVRTLIDNGYEAKTGYWAERGGGMLLFKAADLDEAKSIVADDPLVKSGCVNYELHEWVLVVE